MFCEFALFRASFTLPGLTPTPRRTTTSETNTPRDLCSGVAVEREEGFGRQGVEKMSASVAALPIRKHYNRAGKGNLAVCTRSSPSGMRTKPLRERRTAGVSRLVSATYQPAYAGRSPGLSARSKDQ